MNKQCVRIGLTNMCACGSRSCADARRPRVRCLALRDVLGTDEPLQFWQFVRVTNTQPGTASSCVGRGQSYPVCVNSQ